MSVTQQLVDDVIAAGRSLRVAQHRAWEKGASTSAVAPSWPRPTARCRPARRSSCLDATADWLQIDLVDAFGGPAFELRPVIVPQRVDKHHPLVRRFRDRSAQHEVSRAALPRVVRILHALVHEAGNRKHEVALVEGRNTRRGQDAWTGPKNAHLSGVLPALFARAAEMTP